MRARKHAAVTAPGVKVKRDLQVRGEDAEVGRDLPEVQVRAVHPLQLTVRLAAAAAGATSVPGGVPRWSRRCPLLRRQRGLVLHERGASHLHAAPDQECEGQAGPQRREPGTGPGHGRRCCRSLKFVVQKFPKIGENPGEKPEPEIRMTARVPAAADLIRLT